MSKTVFITGSSSGIGKACVFYFAKKGWNVAATMRVLANKSDFAALSKVKLYKLDVNEESSVNKTVETIMQDFDGIDVVVNNAGYAVDGVFEEIDDEIIRSQFSTNVFGLMRVTRAIIPYMRKIKSGTIVQVSSMGGRTTFPMYSIYHSTKWAVEGFSESLQYELRQFNIRIKIIEPGVIKTNFYGKSREKIETSILEYQDFIQKCEVVSQSSGNNGANPEIVAKCIYSAATDSSWKLRYPIGSPAPMLLFFRKLIPENWFFPFIRRGFKI